MACRLLFLLFCFCMGSAAALAQVAAAPDTALKQVVTDSLRTQKTREAGEPAIVSPDVTISNRFQPDAKKAGMFAAILPGLGQAYNRQYWKLPIVYAGVGAAAYFIHFNNSKYQDYRKAYIARIDGDPNTVDPYVGFRSDNDLKVLRDGYKQYLDITILVTGLGYILQVMDAVVYAHLKNFDVSQDLSLRVMPVVGPSYAGIGLVISLK